jgi:DeoR/GlpR family transcriptional regulator of sugar metabolism
MLAIERRRRIMSMLQEKQSVLVPELSRIFEVTEETIRRDLEKLEQDGLLKRTYGGAILNESINIDLPLNIREITNIEGKEAIGRKVAEYIEDGDTVMLDSSSTALQVAKNLRNKKKITVITNSVKIVLELANASNCTVISTGGTLRPNAMSFAGSQSEKAIQNYNVDKAVISCKGVHMQRGISDSNEMEVEVKKSMKNASEKFFLAVDHTKFDKSSFIKMMNFEGIDCIFTDRKLSQQWEDMLKNYNIRLVYC